MVYEVTRMVKGNPYRYLQESFREGDKVRTRTVQYIGPGRSSKGGNPSGGGNPSKGGNPNGNPPQIKKLDPRVLKEVFKTEKIKTPQIKKTPTPQTSKVVLGRIDPEITQIKVDQGTTTNINKISSSDMQQIIGQLQTQAIIKGETPEERFLTSKGLRKVGPI